MIGAFLPRLVALLHQTQIQAQQRALQQAQAAQQPPGGAPGTPPAPMSPQGMPPR
jgi:hypothetical protein